MNYKHLTEDERYQIDELSRISFTQLAIAKKLNRSPSTLSRELKRNEGERGWKPRQAQLNAMAKLIKRGQGNVKRADESAWDYAKAHLKDEQWSPQQIANRLLHEGLASISHETIYQRILADKEQGGFLYCHLRCKKTTKKTLWIK